MTETKPAPTYGVTESEFGGDEYFFLGSDETLWDWATAPVAPFTESSTEIPLPEGYVMVDQPGRGTKVFNRNDGLPEGVDDLSGATTTVTITSGSAMEDKIQILTCSMENVEPKEFRNAGLPEDRVLETVAY